MKLTNTLTHQLTPFKPLQPGQVKLYTCGPTVYDDSQIGNWRNQVFNDTLVRVLKLAGYRVDRVMNITDVGHLVSDADEGEDKFEKGARREGTSAWEVAKHYTENYWRDATRLNLERPTQVIKATDAIESQIALVQRLWNKGFVYQTTQAIYFDVTKVADYGKLSGQKLADKEVGARSEVVTDSEKHHPQDFAVWFFTVGHFAEHEMRWPSPWGEGFPGWHLECSAIIHQTLGEPIDIHTGGIDHIGTHHTNEIAQSEAAYGKPLANLWVHNQFLLVDGQRMGKSLGNFYTLQDVIDRGFNPMALRLLYLQSHYRSEQNFTWEGLQAAANYLGRLQAWADGQFQSGGGPLADDHFATIQEQMVIALEDDLNTPRALVATNQLLDEMELRGYLATAEQVAFVESWAGLRLTERSDITSEQKAVIREREGARTARDYATADAARDHLRQAGIELDDTPHGPRWRRVA